MTEYDDYSVETRHRPVYANRKPWPNNPPIFIVDHHTPTYEWVLRIPWIRSYRTETSLKTDIAIYYGVWFSDVRLKRI